MTHWFLGQSQLQLILGHHFVKFTVKGTSIFFLVESDLLNAIMKPVYELCGELRLKLDQTSLLTEIIPVYVAV